MKVRGYWEQRVRDHGRAAVNFKNRPLEEYYPDRIRFVKPEISTTATTLDFGCGVGVYAKLFPPSRYLGVDISQGMVSLARATHKGYNFALVSDRLPLFNSPNQALLMTVLQHNDDAEVAAILETLKGCQPKSLLLYEATGDGIDKDFMYFRTEKEYVNFVREAFPQAKVIKRKAHTIHGAQHSLIKFKIQ